MKDKEARQATLANKQAIEHFFETEKAFLDTFAEHEVKIQVLTGRILAIQLVLGMLAKCTYEDSDKARETILSSLALFTQKNLEMLEKAERGQSNISPALVDGSQSVLNSIHQLLEDAKV